MATVTLQRSSDAKCGSELHTFLPETSSDSGQAADELAIAGIATVALLIIGLISFPKHKPKPKEDSAVAVDDFTKNEITDHRWACTQRVSQVASRRSDRQASPLSVHELS